MLCVPSLTELKFHQIVDKFANSSPRGSHLPVKDRECLISGPHEKPAKV